MRRRGVSKDKLISCAVCLAVGAGLVLAVLLIEGYWKSDASMERVRILCDGFFVSGAVLILVTGLLFVNGQGGLNGVLYGVKRMWRLLLPFLSSEFMTYEEFVRRREKKRFTGYGCVLLAGLAFLLVGVLLFIWFKRQHP